MHRPLRSLALVAALALPLAAPVDAASVRAPLTYDGFYVLGDSLSDNGNAHRITRGREPAQPPYRRNRFTNGAVWADHVALAFRNEGHDTGNFAVGGARARIERPSVGLLAQRVAFRANANPGANPLVAINIGSNDVLDHVGSDRMPRIARQAADRVIATAASLRTDGVNSVMLFKLANLGQTPRYVTGAPDLRASARRGSVIFNNRLVQGIASLERLGMEVTTVETFALFNGVRDNPQTYGITNFTRPCVVDGRNTCSPRQARRTAFYDDIHPTAALHTLLAREVLNLLAPVQRSTSLSAIAAGAPAVAAVAPATPVAAPIPAPALLLLAGIGGIAFVGRSRVRRAGSISAAPR